MEMGEERTGRSGSSKWKRMKDLLTSKSLSCCGSLWANSSRLANHHRTPIEDEEARYYSSSDFHPDYSQAQPVQPTFTNSTTNPRGEIVTRVSNRRTLPRRNLAEGMNLASALAAERQVRAESESRKEPLVRSLEEKEREEKEIEDGGGDLKEEEGGAGCSFCCVCTGREKGAALIPCGHTYCRVCARGLWVNGGSCPLCNRNVVEILDIF